MKWRRISRRNKGKNLLVPHKKDLKEPKVLAPALIVERVLCVTNTSKCTCWFTPERSPSRAFSADEASDVKETWPNTPGSTPESVRTRVLSVERASRAHTSSKVTSSSTLEWDLLAVISARKPSSWPRTFRDTWRFIKIGSRACVRSAERGFFI